MYLKLLTAAALAAIVAPVQAANVSGLYNTGVDANHVALVGDVADPHYQIVANDGAQAAGTQAVAGNCCYAPDDAQSRWITIDAQGQDATMTDYQTTFTVADATAGLSLSGSFAADNHATVFLNGVSTGFHTDTFSFQTPFTLTRGFVTGLNTLDFRVDNDGGPQSLRVADLAGTAATAGAVPEPAAWAMLVVGFAGVGGLARARRKGVVAA